jgi:hypothetical protein
MRDVVPAAMLYSESDANGDQPSSSSSEEVSSSSSSSRGAGPSNGPASGVSGSIARGSSSGVNGRASAGFDWQAALLAYAQLAQPGPNGVAGQGGSAGSRSSSSSRELASGGSGGGSAAGLTVSVEGEAPREGELGEAWQLRGLEHPSPVGRPWASVWRGPQHVFFGHDAKRCGPDSRRACWPVRLLSWPLFCVLPVCKKLLTALGL